MSLKSALFEMKEGLVELTSELSEEQFIHDLETKHDLKEGSLIWYFNQLKVINMQSRESKNQQIEDSKKINRKWSKNEINFMLRYIHERQEEWGVNITENLDELANLLNRGYQSVNYKYYSIIKTNQDNRMDNQNLYQITTISQKSIPVLTTEVIPVESVLQEYNSGDVSTENDDLLEILSGLLSNVQNLPGINLNELLRSLYKLTNMALRNQNAHQEIEIEKSKVNREKETLQDKLVKKEQQLLLEKKRNDELKLVVSKLAMEIGNFNQLGDTAKIQNLKSYNQKLSYLIAGFGLMHKVGS